jgi:hypothetical protein
VGKTLVARLCAELAGADATPIRLYDLGSEGPALTDFLPGLATRASIADVRGQMALFDQLAVGDGIPKVVDIGTRVSAAFFHFMRKIEFAIETRRRSISTSVLFIAGLDEASVTTYASLCEQFPDFTFMPVHNEAVASGREVRRLFPTNRVGLLPLVIRRLPPNLQHVTSRPLFSFSGFHRHHLQRLDPELSGELDAWLRRVFRQLRELELSVMIASLRPALAVDMMRKPTGNG